MPPRCGLSRACHFRSLHCPASCNQKKSGRWDSNPRRPAWEADILPLNYARNCFISKNLQTASRLQSLFHGSFYGKPRPFSAFTRRYNTPEPGRWQAFYCVYRFTLPACAIPSGTPNGETAFAYSAMAKSGYIGDGTLFTPARWIMMPGAAADDSQFTQRWHKR